MELDWDWFRRRSVRLILGPPGTGKTHSLVQWVSPNSLLITFNVSAVEEAKSRGAVASTIHSLAVQAARSEGYSLPGTGNADIMINVLRARIARRHGLPYSLNPFYVRRGNKLFHYFDYAVHRWGRSGLDHVKPAPRAIMLEYLERLERDNTIDFTTAFLHARGFLHNASRLLIDEAQDLSPTMWRFIIESFDPEEVIIAGDDDQTIYHELHAADPSILGEVSKYAEVSVLQESRRVPRRVASIAERVIAPTRLLPKAWRPRPAEGEVEVINGLVDGAMREVGLGRKVFVVARTNEVVLLALHAFLMRGVIPGVMKRPEPPILRAVREYIANGEARVMGRRNKAMLRRIINTVRERREEEVLGRGVITAPIIVDTVHQFKGREADSVIIINATSSRIRNVNHDAERRLLYVAITRAKEKLLIYTPPKMRKWFSTSLPTLTT